MIASYLGESTRIENLVSLESLLKEYVGKDLRNTDIHDLEVVTDLMRASGYPLKVIRNKDCFVLIGVYTTLSDESITQYCGVYRKESFSSNEFKMVEVARVNTKFMQNTKENRKFLLSMISVASNILSRGRNVSDICKTLRRMWAGNTSWKKNP